MVIVGGGVCGLFLAYNLTNYFGGKANILVLDNRSRQQHTRQPFRREWLTHVPTGHFKFNGPINVRLLLECFGVNGLIGVPINILEAIFQLSCKAQGVKFYFSAALDYSKLNTDAIHLVFDATGNRFTGCTYVQSDRGELEQIVWHLNRNDSLLV